MSSAKIKEAVDSVKSLNVNISAMDTARILEKVISGTPEDALKLNGEKIRNDSYIMKLITAISFITLFLSMILEVMMKFNIVR